jgi:putative transposase
MTKRVPAYCPEVRARAVRMVLDHQGEHVSQWTAIGSIAEKIGVSGETLRHWVRQAERDQGRAAWSNDGGARAHQGARAGEPGAATSERDPAEGVSLFCAGGARPPVQAMIAFIEEYRARHGVEPICRVLPIAPSTYHAHAPGASIPRSCRPGPGAISL